MNVMLWAGSSAQPSQRLGLHLLPGNRCLRISPMGSQAAVNFLLLGIRERSVGHFRGKAIPDVVHEGDTFRHAKSMNV